MKCGLLVQKGSHSWSVLADSGSPGFLLQPGLEISVLELHSLPLNFDHSSSRTNSILALTLVHSFWHWLTPLHQECLAPREWAVANILWGLFPILYYKRWEKESPIHLKLFMIIGQPTHSRNNLISEMFQFPRLPSNWGCRNNDIRMTCVAMSPLSQTSHQIFPCFCHY